MSSTASAISKNCVWLGTGFEFGIIRRTCKVAHFVHSLKQMLFRNSFSKTAFEFGIIRRTCKVAHFVHSFEQMLSKTAFEFGIIRGTFVHVLLFRKTVFELTRAN